MKNKLPEPEIAADAPFAEDALDRERLAQHLTQRVESSTTPYTLAIDAKWGEGKTTFLKMWKAHLEQLGFVCVYYNAWASDFCRDAFPSMVAELSDSVKGAAGFAKKCAAVAKAMAKNMPGALAGLVGFKDVAQAAVDKTVGEWEPVAAYAEYRKALDDFKAALKEIAAQAGKPLVFMVDELDRCRPTFALDVLEKIKHIFDVPGVYFVVALNKDVLAKTVESVYGSVGGNVYLSKFFDDTHVLRNERDVVEYAMRKTEVSDVLQKSIVTRDYRVKMPTLSDLAGLHSVSLRGQKQIVEIVAGCLSKFPDHQDIAWNILFYFAFLRHVNRPLFDKTLRTTEVAVRRPALMPQIPSRELMTFVQGEESPFSANASIEEDCRILRDLVSPKKYGEIAYIYAALTSLRAQCEREFRSEIGKVAPHLQSIRHFGGEVSHVYHALASINHTQDDAR